MGFYIGVPSLIHILYILKDSSVEVIDEMLTKREEKLNKIKQNLLMAQNMMVQQANQRHNKRTFNIGDYVYLKF